MAFIILRHDIHGIWTVELIEFRSILSLKSPTELLDEYVVAITGKFRIHPLRKPF
jgi:hypothetical protein